MDQEGNEACSKDAEALADTALSASSYIISFFLFFF